MEVVYTFISNFMTSKNNIYACYEVNITYKYTPKK